VSLWNAAARSCDVCEHGATKEVCAIYWIAVDAEQEQRVIALTTTISTAIDDLTFANTVIGDGREDRVTLGERVNEVIQRLAAALDATKAP
jgi:hypothetical protein